jgi:hypothetical protein
MSMFMYIYSYMFTHIHKTCMDSYIYIYHVFYNNLFYNINTLGSVLDLSVILHVYSSTPSNKHHSDDTMQHFYPIYIYTYRER